MRLRPRDKDLPIILSRNFVKRNDNRIDLVWDASDQNADIVGPFTPTVLVLRPHTEEVGLATHDLACDDKLSCGGIWCYAIQVYPYASFLEL